MLTLFVTKKQMTEASVRYFYSLNDHYQNYKSCPQVFWYRFYICPNIKIKNRLIFCSCLATTCSINGTMVQCGFATAW